MSRETGDRYRCESCKAELVYVKGCPCPSTMPHTEICCGVQMAKLKEQAKGQAMNSLKRLN